MSKKIYSLLVCLLFFYISCLSRQEPPQPPSVLALVNGIAIREDDLKFRLNLQGALTNKDIYKKTAYFENLKKETLNRMIDNKSIIEWGDQQGIFLSSKEKAQGMTKLKEGYIESEFEIMLEEKNIPYIKWRDLALENLRVQKILKETLYPKINVTEAAVQLYYQSHRDDFKVDEQVRIRHIVTDTIEKAKQLREKIMQGESFAKLAITHSLSPDRSDGGDLGYFARHTHPQEFDDVCFKLELGEVSPVVKTSYGFHLFKLIDKKPKGILPLEEVEEMIRGTIFKEKLEQQYPHWLQTIKNKSQIRVYDEALKRVTPDTVEIIEGFPRVH